eukprot:scaffold67265_cov51-Attheya_sp.AAC.1
MSWSISRGRRWHVLVGETVGPSMRCSVGDVVGGLVGKGVGPSVVGCLVGDVVGTLVGEIVGLTVGCSVGEVDGNVSAHADRCLVGWFWGNISSSRNGIGDWEQRVHHAVPLSLSAIGIFLVRRGVRF